MIEFMFNERYGKLVFSSYRHSYFRAVKSEMEVRTLKDDGT